MSSNPGFDLGDWSTRKQPNGIPSTGPFETMTDNNDEKLYEVEVYVEEKSDE